MKKNFFYVAILSLLSLVSFGQGGYTPIPKLKITTTPDTNNSTTEVLVRDATTGNVGKVAKSSLAGTLDSVTDAGATTNNVISTGGVGINTTTPQAIFDVVSTTSGVLIPRMTTTQRDAISTPINSMLIYNSTNERFEYYKDGIWYSDEQGLQRVLEVGSSATLGDYTVDLGILSGSDVIGFAFNYDNGTVFNEVSMTSGAILLQSQTASKYGNLEITENADFNLVSGSGANYTTVTFDDATETTTLKFPAKPSGEYTLATTSDLETGFETAFLNTTQSITASTDTVITITGATQTENGNVNLLDLTNNIITPEEVNDVLAIDLALPFTTPSGTNNYVSLILRVKTTGTIYRAVNHLMVKGSGNQDYLTASFTVPINSEAQTNGLEFIVNSNVGFTIDSKFLSVTRIHKAQ